MSVVVGITSESGKVFLASDHQATDGWGAVIMCEPKVFEISGVVVGVVGSFRIFQVLKQQFSRSMFDSGFLSDIIKLLREHGCLTVEGSMVGDAQILFGLEGRLFRIANDFQVIEREIGFDAIGSGADVAQGVMWALQHEETPGEIVKLAVEAAIQLDIGCGGDITVVST